jgi:polyisoprenoid-binding protein YceI
MKNLLLLFSLVIFSISAQAADTYKFDPNHTNINWSANHFGFSSPSGKFTESSGILVLDELNPSRSKVEFTVRTSSILTGILNFDNHLKGENFLNTTKFPLATFISANVQIRGGNMAQVHGDLTILGKTQPASFEVRLNKIDISPISQIKTAGFSVKGTIKRSDFGMNFGIPGISDDVHINIEAEATLSQKNSDAPSNRSSNSSNNGSSQNSGSWKIIQDQSKIEFIADQNNSTINGSFKKFDGTINFDPKNLGASKVNIKVDTNSVGISFTESAAILKSDSWLSSTKFPEATFTSNNFIKINDTYTSFGTMTIKGRSTPVTVNFDLQEYSESLGTATAVGHFKMNRSSFGIGDIDPRKANDIKDEITINFTIKAEK